MSNPGLISRVKSILLSPKREWQVIADEPATTGGLYTGYIMILAALPALAGFIKGSLIGHSAFGITVTTPILAGLIGMVVSYVLALLVVYLVALLVNALAGSFDGQKNQVQALKTIAYAWTAAWVAGIAVIVPWLGWLIALAGGLYSIYLLYLGLPHTMKCPREKAIGYTAVIVIIAFVLSILIGFMVAAVTGLGALSGAAISADTGNANVSVDEDSRLGQLAALGQRIEAAREEAGQGAATQTQSSQSPSSGEASALAELMAMGQAMQSGAQPQAQTGQGQAPASAQAQAQASQQALGSMMSAMFGATRNGEPVQALSPDQLKAFLPESLGGMARQSLSAQSQAGMGMQITEASARYAGDDNRQVSIELVDGAAMSGMMAMMGGMAPQSETQTASGYEKDYTRDGLRIHEKWNKNTHRGEYGITIGSRFEVKARGEVQSMDQLKALVGSLDLAKLAALAEAGAGQQQ